MRISILGAIVMIAALTGSAATLDTIGVTVLRAATTNLDGSGIRIAQPEAGAPAFEVNPAAVGQPAGLFTYLSGAGTANGFPNALGTESSHADSVGAALYGLPGGAATNVLHVDNYDAGYFLNSIVALRTAINAPVVNQSFVLNTAGVAQQQAVDTLYDNYAAQYHTLFISGAGNGGAVGAPATCYNGIGVAAFGGSSSVGPAPDNGRAKPDLTAPASATSFSTPLVSGAAAILLQAALRGDGGADTNSAADPRTLKALLLNGAIKPVDWTAPAGSPLDTRYGAGVLNVFNAYCQLTGGKHPFIDSTSTVIGSGHPPTGATGTVGTLSGWDLNTVASSAVADGVKHYYFNVTNSVSNATFTCTATLVWNRQQNLSGINDLDLLLYDAGSGNLIAASTSAVDNVEHLFVASLPAGRYDLQVLKNGGAAPKNLSVNETYALAFEFFNVSPRVSAFGNNVLVSWPVYPDGFALEASANLSPTNWATLNATTIITNRENRVNVDAAGGFQFFRLRRP